MRSLTSVNFAALSDVELVECVAKLCATGCRIDFNAYFVELEERQINVDLLPGISTFIPLDAKLANGTIWNMSRRIIPMVGSGYLELSKVREFMEDLEEIEDKELITFDYIFCQIDTIIEGLKKVDDDMNVLNRNQVFLYYQHKDRIYPDIMPYSESGTAYYVVFKRHSYCRSVQSVALYNQNHEKLKELVVEKDVNLSR